MTKAVYRRYSTKEIYNQQKETGNIPDGAIFFIFETKQIGTRKGDSYLLVSSENLDERLTNLERLAAELNDEFIQFKEDVAQNINDLRIAINTELGFVDNKYVPVNKDLSDKTVSSALDFLADEKYRSEMPDDLEVPNEIGGLAAGTTAEELKKQSISQVLDNILFPEIQPNITNPSANLSFKNGGGFSNGGIYEVGSIAPIIDNFTTSFNRGSSKVPGKPDLYRAGELINDDRTFIYYGASNKTLPEKVILNEMSYIYQVHYGQGDELITSKGNIASIKPNPLPEGTLNSNRIIINGTYPYFCNGTSASSSNQETTFPSTPSDTKLPLVKWNTVLVGAKFASEASTNTRLTFDYPSTKHVTKVEFMNTVSGKWEVFAAYTISEAPDRIIQGNNINYSRLTTIGSLSGALQLRFTLNNK